jgi:hypothetical protein
MQTTLNRRTVLFALVVGAAVLAFAWWIRTPPSKARQLQPLLTEMDAYASTSGTYPTSCVGFPSFAQLTQRFSVYTGGRDTNGVTWETREVSDHDFTVGRMKPLSFSSFPVWRYDSSRHRWQKGRIHWSFAGSHWSKD